MKEKDNINHKEYKMKQHLICCTWIVLMLLGALLPNSAGAAMKYIHGLQVQQAVVDTARGQTAAITWQTRTSGLIDLAICDMDGVVVRHLMQEAAIKSGTHNATWDGKDDDGNFVPNGAYFPFIRLSTQRGSMELFDPTHGKWGGRLPVKDLEYDADTKQITYALEESALCQVRVGEKEGGPSYGTLIHWQPRIAGTHTENWNGKDLQNLFSVHNRGKFQIIFDTLALPPTALLVTGSESTLTKPESNADRMAVFPPTGKEVYIHSLHSRHICQDPLLEVTISSNPKINSEGLPIAGRAIQFEVTASDEDVAQNLMREGCEVYAFIDGEFQKEIKSASLPAKIDVRTLNLESGRHVITFNLRSVEDHVGSYSMEVVKE